jgi:hypothetical protein
MTLSGGCSELTPHFFRSYNSRFGVRNDNVFVNAVILYQKVTFSQLCVYIHRKVHHIFVKFWLVWQYYILIGFLPFTE